ncbi:hypothetical protein C4D60_Mb03t15580 [Musa balbisiana]|uniref:Uncharacterized protein n=1 Tax=Musa balbisiana TaxID=52838 RepID=A0A4S8JAH8_MUSBA|nr:hypothetical protein C4D60_Mb03t15580 [Musa balbisiana]
MAAAWAVVRRCGVSAATVATAVVAWRKRKRKGKEKERKGEKGAAAMAAMAAAYVVAVSTKDEEEEGSMVEGAVTVVAAIAFGKEKEGMRVRESR